MLKHANTPSAFADITPLLDHLPPAPAVPNADLFLTPLQAAHVQPGPLLPTLQHLQRWQKHGPSLTHPRVILFASHYAAPVDAAAKTKNTIAALQANSHPVKTIAATLNVDLRVYEMDLDHAARTPAQAAQAMTYGMLAIEEKGNVIVIASLSEGSEQAAQTLKILAGKTTDDVLQSLVSHMGLDFFASLGAALAARLAGQPVLFAGAFGSAVMRVLAQLSDQAAEHSLMVDATDFARSLPPVFAALQQLQQLQFVMSFLPASLKRNGPIQHVQLV